MNVLIRDIRAILNKNDIEGYMVGGYIRDKLINPKNEPKDIDIVIEKNVERVLGELYDIGYSVFTLKEGMDIYRAIKGENVIDLAQMKGESIEEDLSKRDFTINAIALKLSNNEIIDPFSGRKHIESRIIHIISEQNIKNDRVRILRGNRISIKNGMHFSKQCEEVFFKESKHIMECPKERIFNELMLIIKGDVQGIAFERLDSSGTLKYLLPYIDELKRIGKCRYHIEDAFTHMNLVYKIFINLYNKRLLLNGLDESIFEHTIGQYCTWIYMAFAAFCHDIGKVDSYSNNLGKISFVGHEKRGSEIMREVCRGLGFPKKAIRFVETLIEAHMYPLGLCKNNVKKQKKSFYKFFSRYDKYIPYILTLSYCDMYATKMLYDPDNEKDTFMNYLEMLFKEYDLYKQAKENKLLTGKEVINITGVSGENVGVVLKELERGTYCGYIKNKNEAMKVAMNISKFYKK